MPKNFRILSLDGGGLRGIVTVTILKEIEKRTGKRIVDMFDLIAGTSTGALIACGLTVSDDGINPKYSIADVEKVYTERGKLIFPPKAFLNRFFLGIASLKNPKYNPDGLQLELERLMGEKRLSDCVLPVFITAYDLYNNEALLFKYRKALIDPERNARLVDICRATSAAPTYLPAYSFRYLGVKRICIDGGLFMNNPSVGAFVEVSKHHAEKPYNRPDLTVKNISILSIGTGQYSSEISRQNAEGAGTLDWAFNITDIMMQGINQTADYQANELTQTENYCRLNINIVEAKYSNMADSSDSTREYLIAEVNSQIIGNTVLMGKLHEFLLNNEL